MFNYLFSGVQNQKFKRDSRLLFNINFIHNLSILSRVCMKSAITTFLFVLSKTCLNQRTVLNLHIFSNFKERIAFFKMIIIFGPL